MKLAIISKNLFVPVPKGVPPYRVTSGQSAKNNGP